MLLFCLLSFLQVHRSSFQELPEHSCGSKDASKAAADGGAINDPAAADNNVETSVFYQSLMGWKNLQAWAQRVWAKHYQQSPIGSTQNVRPIIVHGPLGIEYISSAAESSPCDHNEAETRFSYHGNSQPTNQHEVSVGQNSSPANQSQVSNAAVQPAIRSLVLVSQSEALNAAANQGSVVANHNVGAGRGSGQVCCHGDDVNRLSIRCPALDVTSPIERDLQTAAARHRDRLTLSQSTRLEQTKNNNKSRCTLYTR